MGDVGKGPAVDEGGRAPPGSAIRLGLMASLHQDGHGPRHSQVLGGDGIAFLSVSATMAPRRSRMSARSVVRARMAMISLATVISYPERCSKPFSSLPKPTMISRRKRSFTIDHSSTRLCHLGIYIQAAKAAALFGSGNSGQPW